MGRVFSGVAIMVAIYVSYKVGKSDGHKEEALLWRAGCRKEEKNGADN